MQARQARVMQEHLEHGADFLSTVGRLSEMNVLSVARDLEENSYQVGVSLTKEWQKLEHRRLLVKWMSPGSQLGVGCAQARSPTHIHVR